MKMRGCDTMCPTQGYSEMGDRAVTGFLWVVSGEIFEGRLNMFCGRSLCQSLIRCRNTG
jgi:hypothetical protein